MQIESATGEPALGLDVTGSYRYPPPNAAWLDLRREAVLEAELPIIDCHHHLWVENGHAYLVEDLLEDLASGHNVIATVGVEARYSYRAGGPDELRSVGETEHLAMSAEAAQARRAHADVCAGIVAHVDLRARELVEQILDAHYEAAPDRFKGVRHSVSRDSNFPDGIVLRPAPAGLLADADYRAGMAAISRRGLSYDAMLYHQQIPELTAAARALDDLPIVLNHLGCILGVGPYLECKTETFQSWRRDVAELAKCPNVWVKLGGLGMIVCGAAWHVATRPPSSDDLAEAWRPYVETCIELFGADRCMFESNFPVDKAMYSYEVLWNAFKKLAASASPSEKTSLFSDAAARFYRLSAE